jgi:hypothetical protein
LPLAEKIIIPLILGLVSVVGLALSFNIEQSDVFDPSSPAFLPAVLSVIMLGCSVAIGWRGARSLSFSVDSQKQAEGGQEGGAENRSVYGTIGIFLLLLIAYAVLMNYMNFFILSIVYLFLSMILLNRKKWRGSLIVAVASAAVIYYSFVYLFKVVFPY